MNLYKIYVKTKKKDGTITKSEAITTRSDNVQSAIESVIKQAKNWYGYKGKIHVGSIFKREISSKTYSRIDETEKTYLE